MVDFLSDGELNLDDDQKKDKESMNHPNFLQCPMSINRKRKFKDFSHERVKRTKNDIVHSNDATKCSSTTLVVDQSTSFSHSSVKIQNSSLATCHNDSDRLSPTPSHSSNQQCSPNNADEQAKELSQDDSVMDASCDTSILKNSEINGADDSLINSDIEEDINEGNSDDTVKYQLTFSPTHEANLESPNAKPFKACELVAPTGLETLHLPNRWFPINHKSGIKIYWNPDLKLATVSPPYCINTRREATNHRIPLAAIPCLAYKTALEKERAQNQDSSEQPNEVSDTANEKSSQEPINNETDDNTADVNEPPVQEKEPEPIEEVPEVLAPTMENNSLEESVPILPEESDKEEGECSSDEEAGAKVKAQDEPAPELTAQNADPSAKNDSTVDVVASPVQENCVAASSDQTDSNKMQESFVPAKPTVTVLETSVITPETLQKIVSLSCEEVRQYCDNLFKFRSKTAFHKKMNFIRRRLANQAKKRKKGKPMEEDEVGQPVDVETEVQLPPDKKQMVNSIMYKKKVGNVVKEGSINVKGKSFIGILHEYCQVVLHDKVNFSEEPSDNARAPYRVTALLNDVPHGIGEGDSKKAAKSKAAEETLRMLINDFDKVIASSNSTPPSDLSMFDSISITDPRVTELSHNVNLPNPSLILEECLKRNCYSKEKSNIQMLPSSKGRQLFVMELGKHKVEINCRTKRDGKQLASQAMLKKLHPNLHSWGAILRLYGPGSKPSIKDDLDEIKGIQNKQKGYVKTGLISVLKNKMRELAKQWEENGEQSKGKFSSVPQFLPKIDFHPDAYTGLYSVAQDGCNSENATSLQSEPN